MILHKLVRTQVRISVGPGAANLRSRTRPGRRRGEVTGTKRQRQQETREEATEKRFNVGRALNTRWRSRKAAETTERNNVRGTRKRQGQQRRQRQNMQVTCAEAMLCTCRPAYMHEDLHVEV